MLDDGLEMMMAGANSLEGVLFDGINDYLARTTPLTSIGTVTTFTVSAWLKFTAGGTVMQISTQTGGLIFRFSTAPSSISFGGNNASGTTVFGAVYSTSIANGQWRHVLLSVDLSNTSKRHLLIDGIAVSPTWSPYVSNSIAFDTLQSRASIGAVPIDNNQKYNGSLAFLYFSSVYFDLSDAAQVAKFITTEGEPAKRNANGSWGDASDSDAQPTLWLSGGPSNFVTNQGNGGSFTLSGTLDASTGSIEIAN